MRLPTRRGMVVVFILCAAGGVAAFQIVRESLHLQPTRGVANHASPDEILPLVSIKPVPDSQNIGTLITDMRRPIKLYIADGDNQPPSQAILDIQAQVERDLHLVRHGPQFEPCNCHGWIFAEGKYWIKPEDVEIILLDNGYQAVAEPLAGDLVIYRDPTGYIAHSGIVQKVARSNEVTVESRWGNLGRYFHAPDKQVFSKSFTYYRSARQGHTLAGIPHGLQASPLPEIEE